jgi:nicotinamidase-related amidase
MDVQPGILERVPNHEEYLANVTSMVARARDKGLPIIFVVVGFRPGAPEASAAMKERARGLVNAHPAIEPQEDDFVVVKRRVSAFTGSDLEVVLRAQNIGHMVLAGIATGGVVLSTLREAVDKDYKITVLSDLCADFDPEVHAILVNKIFPRQATVITGEEWIAAI